MGEKTNHKIEENETITKQNKKTEWLPILKIEIQEKK